jgi:hypothetical protein
MRRGDVLKKTMTHHQSQNDASIPVRQHARMATWPLHTPFVLPVNHLSTDAEPNANGTISTQGIHLNAAIVLNEQ